MKFTPYATYPINTAARLYKKIDKLSESTCPVGSAHPSETILAI